MAKKVWTYFHAKAIRIIDGDTLELDIDLGNCQHWIDKFRLFGVDTAERAAGLVAKTFVMEWLAENGIGYIETHGRDKYGRWLAVIVSNERSLNAELLSEGLAVPYDGGRK